MNKGALKNKHILFVTDEFYPINNGGIARLLNTISKELVRAGYRVSVLFSFEDTNAVKLFRKEEFNGCFSDSLFKIYTVNEILENSPFDNIYSSWIHISDKLHISYRIALAIRKLSNDHRFDLIEFNDCWGFGYIFFKWRKLLRDSFASTPAWVRLHGTIENCMYADNRNEEAFYSYNYHFFGMERESLKSADGLIASSISVGEWYKRTYSLNNSTPIAVSIPPFEKIGAFDIHPKTITNTPFKILFYGRIQHLKGVDTLIKSVINVMHKTNIYIQVELIGGIVEGYDQYLLSLIPLYFQDRFIFRGRINPQDLPDYVVSNHVAIVSSYTETFCLALHEMNWIGIPLIINNIPAFKDFFKHEENCLFYNGTINDLEKQILCFFSKPKWPFINNAREIQNKSSIIRTYEDIISNNINIGITGYKYRDLSLSQYESIFYYLNFLMFFSKEVSHKVRTDTENFYIPDVYAVKNDLMRDFAVDELNVKLLTINDSYKGQLLLRLQSEYTSDCSKELNYQKELNNILRDWYHKEYDVLPLWFKRLGHIVKAFQGHRSLKSLFIDELPEDK